MGHVKGEEVGFSYTGTDECTGERVRRAASPQPFIACNRMVWVQAPCAETGNFSTLSLPSEKSRKDLPLVSIDSGDS